MINLFNRNTCPRWLSKDLSQGFRRQSKPPDPNSIVSLQQKNEVDRLRRELEEEKYKSITRDEEIEDLQKELSQIRQEKNEVDRRYEQLKQQHQQLKTEQQQNISILEDKNREISNFESEIDDLQKRTNIYQQQFQESIETENQLTQSFSSQTNNNAILTHIIRILIVIISTLQIQIRRKEDASQYDTGTHDETEQTNSPVSNVPNVPRLTEDDLKENLKQDIQLLQAENLALRQTNESLMSEYNELRDKFEKQDEQKATQNNLNSVMSRRHELLTNIQDIRGNIRVFCRIRPPRNTFSNMQPFLSTSENNWEIKHRNQNFNFDHVFQSSVTNKDVYNETAGVVEMVLGGQNVCIMAYGQTGSGKTYTMDGVKDDPGVNLQALQHLFRRIDDEREDATVTISVLQIYNEEIQDLLVERSHHAAGSSAMHSNQQKQRKLDIQRISASSHRVHVPGAVRKIVSSTQDAWEVMKAASRRRSVSSTRMNGVSSRSHMVVEVEVCRGLTSAKLNMVDLAGSERISRSGVTSGGLQEAKAINKSLSTLGNVFSSLGSHREHVPYRDSKLTYLLKDSIGGLAKTLMFVTVSGDPPDEYETKATLAFGKRVSNVMLGGAVEGEKLERLQLLESEMQEVDESIAELKRMLLTCQ